MAYQKDWRDEEDPTSATALGAAKQNTSGVIDGQTSPDSTATSGSGPAKAPAQEGTGSGFVNLQAYMDANKGEGGRMVNSGTADLTGSADKYKDTAAQTVADQTKAMQAATGSDKLPGLKQGLATDASANGGAARDFVNSTAYSGPTADQASAGLAAQQKDLAGKLGSVSGDSVIQGLKDKTGTPYSSGFGYLDKFLMGDKSGQDALNAVHSKVGDVNDAYNDASLKLSRAETAARGQLDANKQAVRDAAAADMGKITAAGQARAADLNKGLDLTNYTGAVQHSLAGGLSDKDRSDLEALAAITGGAKGDWYHDTYNQGTAKPISVDQGTAPPPPPKASAPTIAQKAAAEAPKAPATLAKANQHATSGLNGLQSKVVNAVNAAQTHAADVIGDPTLQKATQGVNGLNNAVTHGTEVLNQLPATVVNQAAASMAPKTTLPPALKKKVPKWAGG